MSQLWSRPFQILSKMLERCNFSEIKFCHLTRGGKKPISFVYLFFGLQHEDCWLCGSFLCLSITLQFFKFLHYVFLYIKTNLIVSYMQLFYISFTTKFFVTRAILRFFLCIFIGENFAQDVISHKKTFCIVSFANSVIQTNFIVSKVQSIYIACQYNVYPSHV